MSDGHIFNKFGGQPHAIPRSSFSLFHLFAFLSAGAVDKIVLPVGMKSVDFSYCISNLTGTAELEDD